MRKKEVRMSTREARFIIVTLTRKFVARWEEKISEIVIPPKVHISIMLGNILKCARDFMRKNFAI